MRAGYRRLSVPNAGLAAVLDYALHEGISRGAEKTWNWQFVLVTPRTYSELDYISMAGSGWKVRPNVLCLFRLSLFSDAGIFDSSPAAGPLRFGTPHRTINVFNLALNTQTVKLAPGITVDANHPATRTFSQMDGLSFRSNADTYDDSDLFKPGWWNKEHKVVSNTVSHEIGHALGQCHIMGLKGDPQYALGAPTAMIPPPTASAPATLWIPGTSWEAAIGFICSTPFPGRSGSFSIPASPPTSGWRQGS